jgi:hypothetical protein
VEESATLKIEHRLATVLIFRRAGLSGPRSPGEPVFAVACFAGGLDESRLEASAKQAATQIKGIADVHKIDGSPVRVDGLPAFELTADAHRSDSPDPVRLYALLVADGTAQRTYFAFGYVPAADAQKTMEDFKAVAHSLKVER